MSSPVTTTTATAMSLQYIPMSLSEAIGVVGGKHASHCLLYSSANCSGVSYVLLQMRFDGLIGFAGGEVDVHDVTVDDIIEATNRELNEEIAYDLSGVTAEEWICSHRDAGSSFIQHFFAKELTFDELRQLETTHMTAQHFPSESLGVFRVPIGGFDQKETSKKFLQNFLRQKFAGNARQQFIETIKKLSLVSSEDLKWIESNECHDIDDNLVNGHDVSVEVKALLRTELPVHYYDESVDVSYGLMVVRDNGLFDFIGTHFVESNDQNSMIEALNNSLEKDLGSDWSAIDWKCGAIPLSLDNGLSHVFCININSDQFTQIEEHFTESKSFGVKSYGLIRIPFLFRGSTQKSDSYVNRFFNGFFKQYFANNSKMHLKHIYESNYKNHL